MHARNPVLPEAPKRPPYCTFTVRGVTYTLRAPSMAKVAAMTKRLPEEQRNDLYLLPTMAGLDTPLMSALMGRPDGFALLAAVVGICWADPAFGLDTPPWTEGDLVPYGEAVYEELHEAGWTLNQLAVAALAVVTHVAQENVLDAAVIERTAVFRLPTANSSESESPSSATSSSPIEGSGSTN